MTTDSNAIVKCQKHLADEIDDLPEGELEAIRARFLALIAELQRQRIIAPSYWHQSGPSS